jgi:4'-phosphopantetheinyl transferase EntD
MNELHAPSWPSSILSSLTHWECLISKESIYKAWNPLTQRWSHFSAVAIVVELATQNFNAIYEYQRHPKLMSPALTAAGLAKTVIIVTAWPFQDLSPKELLALMVSDTIELP